jgi:gliding motility-associated-like protein
VEDKTAPVFTTCPVDIVVKANTGCEASVNWTEPVASDNCGVGSVTKSHESGSVFPVGTTTVKYTASDVAGNKTVCEFNVVVKIDEAPAFSNCPEDIHAKTDEWGTSIVEWTPPTATISCGTLTLTSTHEPGSIFSPGTTVVKYKAEDAFGNTSYCEFNVIVTEQEIDIEIGRIVTPDGNRDNDELVVKNIERFSKNKIIIVDRWGSVVYTASGYNNSSVVWRGLNTGGGTVPTGTYFYTISVWYGNKVFEKTGFIEVIR